MNTVTLVLVGALVLLAVLYFARRRSRLMNED
jgi:LPXTG-motif cell wall-anchored protein